MTVPIVFCGAMIGMSMAFLISRYVFKDFFVQQINQSPWFRSKFRTINEIVSTEGIIIIALTRLTFAPIGITSYILGVT